MSSAINTSHLRTGSLWKAPYLWLSIAAIAELVVALLLILNLALMLYHNYLWSLPAPPGTIRPAMDVPSVSQTIFYYSPFLASAFACIAGATFLFLGSLFISWRPVDFKPFDHIQLLLSLSVNAWS